MSKKLTLEEVQKTCSDGRFFPYDDWRDSLFVPPATILVWVFLKLGWSGNAVTILSGVTAMVGGILLASNNPVAVVIGSFGYMAFYLLDYVDGGVARIRGQSGIGGQYMDWTMHVVSAVSIAVGLFIGALSVTSVWIIPFGILTVVAAALALDRYSLAWFAICMHYQQQQVKGDLKEPSQVYYKTNSCGPIYRLFRYLSTIVFHENYAIFILPMLAIIQLFWQSMPYDFRVVIVIIGGLIYFPVVLYDIWFLATRGKVDNAYRKLFFSTETPRLPEDHFLK